MFLFKTISINNYIKIKDNNININYYYSFKLYYYKLNIFN